MASLHSVFALVALSAPPALLISQSHPATGACSIRQSNEAVVLMACSPEAGPRTWRAAGQDACGARSACHVWIWDKSALVPATAPATDAELPKDRTSRAIAIWMQDSQQLVILQGAAAPGK